MAQPIDTGPSTSYSDPIYDRLDSLADRLKRHWKLMVVVLLVAVGAFAIAREVMQHDPNASSAQAYAKAMEESTAIERDSALEALSRRTDITPYYQVRALCELAQSALLKGEKTASAGHLNKAAELAKLVGDRELDLQVALSQAAVAEEGKDYDGALALYTKVAGAAKAPEVAAYRLNAEIGGARVLNARGGPGDLEAAIEKLEPVIARKREDLGDAHDYARLLYHKYKRKLAKAEDVTAESLKPREKVSAPKLDLPGGPLPPQTIGPVVPGIAQPPVPGVPPLPTAGLPPTPQPGPPVVPIPALPQPGAGSPPPGVPQPGVPQPGVPQPEGPRPGAPAPR